MSFLLPFVDPLKAVLNLRPFWLVCLRLLHKRRLSYLSGGWRGRFSGTLAVLRVALHQQRLKMYPCCRGPQFSVLALVIQRAFHYIARTSYSAMCAGLDEGGVLRCFTPENVGTRRIRVCLVSIAVCWSRTLVVRALSMRVVAEREGPVKCLLFVGRLVCLEKNVLWNCWSSN